MECNKPEEAPKAHQCGKKKKKATRCETSQCTTTRRKAKCNLSRNKKKFYRAGPITSNPFFNFLRHYRQIHCGTSILEIARKGAILWRRLPDEKRQRFQMQAYMHKMRKKYGDRKKGKKCKAKKSAKKKRDSSCEGTRTRSLKTKARSKPRKKIPRKFQAATFISPRTKPRKTKNCRKTKKKATRKLYASLCVTPRTKPLKTKGCTKSKVKDTRKTKAASKCKQTVKHKPKKCDQPKRNNCAGSSGRRMSSGTSSGANSSISSDRRSCTSFGASSNDISRGKSSGSKRCKSKKC